MIQLLEQQPNPRVFFRPIAWQKMKAMVDYTSTECALEGTVYINEDGEYIIEDVFAYPQTVTSTTVEMDVDRYVDWLNTLNDEAINHKRFQMHSHVNMGVTPSSTDTEHYSKYLENVTDFMIFMIMNKKGEYNIWLYDVASGLMYDKDSLDVGILFDNETSDYDWYCEDVVKQIHKPTQAKPFKAKVVSQDYYGGMLYGGNQYIGSDYGYNY